MVALAAVAIILKAIFKINLPVFDVVFRGIGMGANLLFAVVCKLRVVSEKNKGTTKLESVRRYPLVLAKQGHSKVIGSEILCKTAHR